MSSIVTFPGFKVIDGSWGPSVLTISNSNGLSIVSKESGQLLENWPWSSISNATIKSVPNMLVQVKRPNGIMKAVTFTKAQDLERFERTLKNAVPILSVFNIWRQIKFVVIQPIETAVPITNKLLTKSEPIVDENLNFQVSGFIPPPPPPPPPMFPSSQPMFFKKTQEKPNKVDNPDMASKKSCLVEMKKSFAEGTLWPSQIKRARIGQNSQGPVIATVEAKESSSAEQ